MMYAIAEPPKETNMNTEWCAYPGVWVAYILLLFSSWFVVICFSGWSSGHAWTFVNLAHFVVDNGRQCTTSRKFFTVVPVVLYLIACYTTNYENPMLTLNTIAMVILMVAKFPKMHKVRLFGINADDD